MKANKRDISESESEQDVQPLVQQKVSKNKLKKITADGPF